MSEDHSLHDLKDDLALLVRTLMDDHRVTLRAHGGMFSCRIDDRLLLVTTSGWSIDIFSTMSEVGVSWSQAGALGLLRSVLDEATRAQTLDRLEALMRSESESEP